MTNRNEELVRQAYARGDVTGILDLVDPDLEWTYLDPASALSSSAAARERD